MGNVLGKPPVFHTLVQININEIPNFKDTIDLIHKDFYELGFVEKREEEIEEFQFIPPAKETKIRKMISWHFINFEQDAGFVINPNFILFHTTNYLSFSDFLKKILLGIDIINKYLGLVIVERIGLRYLDAVIIKENERISDYLSKDLLSVQDLLGLDNDGFAIQHAMNEKILVNPEANETCISRVVSANLYNSNPLLPQELVPLVQHLKFKPELKNITGLMTLIDLDSSKNEVRMKATNTDELSNILDKLHTNLSKIFESLVNVEAFK
ncbi:TIGR04255 family protein [Acinetobacter radioresistens]|uniref:TIGR04255 family protein n=1 Tax=Acinetobacter radioresistens TaxID=40216 RepID=UPI000698417C|nr:TIGR04255 family protein [Acinetobacter radioresistens]